MHTTHTALLGVVCALAALLHFCSPAARAREWLDKTEKVKTEAEFISLDGNAVKLRKPDGQELSVPLDELSFGDRRHVRLIKSDGLYKEFLEYCEPLRGRASESTRAKIRSSEDLLKDYKAGRINPQVGGISTTGTGDKRRVAFPSKQFKETQINRLEGEIARLERVLLAVRTAGPAWIPTLPHPPKVGRFGEWPFDVEVIQVIDKDNMIGDWAGESVWMRTSTAGIVDGRTYRSKGKAWKISGTKTYTTAIGGSKTVLFAERVPIPK